MKFAKNLFAFFIKNRTFISKAPISRSAARARVRWKQQTMRLDQINTQLYRFRGYHFRVSQRLLSKSKLDDFIEF